MSNSFVEKAKQEAKETIRDSPVSIALIAVIGLSIFLGCSLYIELHRNVEHPFLKVLADFGLALIDAALVMLIIDRRAAKAQVRETLERVRTATNAIPDTVEKLFSSIYKKSVPEEVIDIYENHVFASKFFRSRLEYNITFDPTREGWVKMDVYNSYTIRNLVAELQQFDFRVEVAMPLADSQVEEIQTVQLTVSGKKNDTVRAVIDRNGVKTVLFSASIPIEAGGKANITCSWFQERRSDDFEIISGLYSSDGIKVMVNHGKSLKINAGAIHPVDLSPDPTNSETRKVWTLQNGILPGQGVCLVWAPVNSKTTEVKS
jgi:hypothetical protein